MKNFTLFELVKKQAHIQVVKTLLDHKNAFVIRARVHEQPCDLWGRKDDDEYYRVFLRFKSGRGVNGFGESTIPEQALLQCLYNAFGLMKVA